jgi:hypothetical protein
MVSWWSNDCLEKYVGISKLTTISIEDVCAVRVDTLQPSENPLSFTVSVSFANLSLQRCCAEKLLSFSGYCKRAFPPGPLSKRPRIFCALLNSIELYQMMPSGFPVMRRRNQGNKYNLQFVYILHNISPRNVPSLTKLFLSPLPFFWSAVGKTCSYDPCPCTKPVVRREWRAFSIEEKAEWICDVNVRMNSRPHVGGFVEVVFEIQCLSKLPDNTALTPLVDPLVSLIPPINASSSYYDGII